VQRVAKFCQQVTIWMVVATSQPQQPPKNFTNGSLVSLDLQLVSYENRALVECEHFYNVVPDCPRRQSNGV